MAASEGLEGLARIDKIGSIGRIGRIVSLYQDKGGIGKFATKLRQKCVCSLWRDCCVLYDPISHEMHVAQQFNMVIG